jgi:hypothetical protein
MAHRVETADRYYNRANLRGERGKALDVIVGTYKVGYIHTYSNKINKKKHSKL